MCGGVAEDDAARADLQEDEHVQDTQPDAVDGQEVAGKNRPSRSARVGGVDQDERLVGPDRFELRSECFEGCLVDGEAPARIGVPTEAACLRDLVGTDHCIEPGLRAHCQRKCASLVSRMAGPEPEVEDDIDAVLEQPWPEIVQERGEAVPPVWFQVRSRFVPGVEAQVPLVSARTGPKPRPRAGTAGAAPPERSDAARPRGPAEGRTEWTTGSARRRFCVVSTCGSGTATG